MAETFLPPPPPRDPKREATLLHAGAELHWTETKEEGVLASLWGSVRDVFFPVKLPPLVLESKPIAVVDRMAVKQNPKAWASSIAFYALLIVLIGWLIHKKVQFSAPVKQVILTDLSRSAPGASKANAMGGGGGQKGPTPVTKGTPPKFADTQLVPPNKPPLIEPKIHIEPTIEVQQDVKMASSLPQIAWRTRRWWDVDGQRRAGRDWVRGMARGLGRAREAIPAADRGGLAAGVSAPQVIFQVEPEFSEEARKAKVAGNVLVNLWVDTNGNPSHVHVIRGVEWGWMRRPSKR